MALLDGKYEIISQEPLGPMQTVFQATAPDGSSLRIVWFELASPQDEEQFELYRRCLRQLRKDDLAAIYDLVSRPGAHYVAWHSSNHYPKAKAPEALEQRLLESGYSLALAEIRHDKATGVKVYDLALDTAQVPTRVGLEVEETSAKPAAPVPRQTPLWLLPWSLAFLLLLLSLTFGLWGFVLQRNDAVVTVPELIGRPINEATAQLYALKLAVSVKATPSSQPPFTVLTVTPPAGSAIRPYHRQVQLSYAVPADQLALASVPDLLEQAFSETSRTTLEAAGFQLGELSYIYSAQKSGTILAQSHRPGSKASAAEAIHLLMSKGPQSSLTFLPRLTGLSLEDARFLIGIAGLKPPEIKEVANSSYPPGTIIEQSIAPFQTISRETNLRLYLASGAAATVAETPIPALIGMSLEQAQAVATAAGYDLNREAIDTIDTPNLPIGIVDQNPEPGSSGSAISVLVNVYVPPLPIPQPEARAAIRQPEERTLSFAWPIELGVEQSFYKVTATTVDGETIEVSRGVVQGGQTVQGSLISRKPRPIRFKLFLQNVPYSIELCESGEGEVVGCR
jgi:eukaryotic-like serine/threonine-protein kinase